MVNGIGGLGYALLGVRDLWLSQMPQKMQLAYTYMVLSICYNIGKTLWNVWKEESEYKNRGTDSRGIEKPRCKYHPEQHFSLSKSKTRHWRTKGVVA